MKHIFARSGEKHGKKQPPAPYDTEHLLPAVRRSICTGEKVAGFVDKRDGTFTEVMLIRTPKDEQKFKEQYKIDSLKVIY